MITKKRLRQLTKYGKPSQKEAREMAAMLLVPPPPKPPVEHLLALRLTSIRDLDRAAVRYRLEATPVEAVVFRRRRDKRRCVDRVVSDMERCPFPSLAAMSVQEAGALLGRELAQDLLLHPHI